MCGPKCVNGISWLLYQNPMTILDETSYFETKRVDDLTIELTTTRSFTCPASSATVPVTDESSFDMSLLQNSVEDTTMNVIESVPISLNHPHNNHGAGRFDTNNNCYPHSAIMPTTGEDPSSIIRRIPPPCVGFHASQGTMAIDQWSNLAQYVMYRIDRLDANEAGELLDMLMRASGPSQDLSGYPGGKAGYIATCLQKLQEAQGTEIASLYNLINSGIAAVGDSDTSDLADYSEQDSRPFVDVSVQGSDNDSDPPPQDTLLLPVPSPVPQEIQALIDAYISGQPLTVIVSNGWLYEHWGLHLPSEFGYVVMGYYRIIGVEENRVQSPDPKFTSNDFISGRVRWRFRIQWSAGGEECVWGNRTDVLHHPWWSPAHKSQADCSSSTVDLPPIETEDFFPTTPHYRNLRKRNHEYQYRHDPLQDFYYYIFPAHLLMPFTALLPDVNFPRGWICRECGRMNFQRSMRHRKCASSSCKKSNPVSYFLDLFLLRDPQDRLTLPLPYNTYPEVGVKVRHARWDDGTQTFSCLIPDANKPTCYIKHVFTSNLPHLQSYTKEWLRNIQLELDIVREPGDNGPYFFYSADVRNRNFPDPRTRGRPEIPDCIINMKDCMVSRAKLYAQIEERDIRIDQLDILAWVTSGSKKYPVPIRATKKAVILLCLGCNTTLIVTPRAKKTFPRSEADEMEENPQGHAGWIFGDDSMGSLIPSASPKKQTATSKRENFSFSLSLVHGDILVFFGDEFECTIKRNGTSFLLMGSCVDLKQEERALGDGISFMRMIP